MVHSIRNSVIGFAAIGLLMGAAPASDPVAAYVLVERAVIVDDGTKPATIEIWGVFGWNQPGVFVTTRGYMYYTPNENGRATRAEWADLQAIAGTKQVVGFGARGVPIGRVRRPSEAPSTPDVYPIGVGLVRALAVPFGVSGMLAVIPNSVAPRDSAQITSDSVTLVVKAAADETLPLVIEVGPVGSFVGSRYECERPCEKSPPMLAKSGQASWTPTMRLTRGASYWWRVYTILPTGGQGWGPFSTFTVAN
jgi:hypothetical protein